MSPSGPRLCLLITVNLILPSGGQPLEQATPVFVLDITPVNIHVPDTASLEVQPSPQTPTRAVDEAAQSQTETKLETQHPTGTDMLLVTDPGTHRSSEGDDDKDNPFTYDNDTLWRRGLLVAAVLFITGIFILTSDKCRKWSRLCFRAYSVVNTRGSEKEEAAGGSHV